MPLTIDTQKTPIALIIGNDQTKTTLADFFATNAGALSEAERSEIIDALKTNGEYHGGGGAAARYQLDVMF